MTTVNIHKAKTELSKLLALVEKGEEVVIARNNVPVAKLVPAAPGIAGMRTPGMLSHLATDLPEDLFFETLSEEELAAWENTDPLLEEK